MIDKIDSMGLDLTKSLHGHVRIETRDRWTGRIIDSQEKDNLVTNALSQLVFSAMWGGSANMTMNTMFSPLYEKALGGVFAFDNTLTASADNVGFPSSAKLVAYAGQDSNASEAIGGSYNGSESTRLSNGFTSVWDFATSQANGTIASIARTSKFFNATPLADSVNYINPFTQGLLNTYAANFYYLGYKESTKRLYLACNTSITVDGVAITAAQIWAAPFDPQKITLMNGLYSPANWTLALTVTNAMGSSQAWRWAYDAYADNFIYRSGTTLHIVDTNETHTSKTLTGAPAGNYIVPTENYYFVNGIGSNVIYRYEKSNIVNAQSYTMPSGFAYMAPAENDMLIVNASTGAACFLYPDGTIIQKDKIGTGSAAQATYNKCGMLYASTYSSGAYMLRPSAHYLGTIANLDSPVTKSSSQTMKITYTLTEA